MPNRNGSQNDQYRYGFQGQEKDDEIKGNGNSINYKYRMHDPRIGRFFALDPLMAKFPDWSPYQFSGNVPIHMVELEGLQTSPAGGSVYGRRTVAHMNTPVGRITLVPGGYINRYRANNSNLQPSTIVPRVVPEHINMRHNNAETLMRAT